MNVQKPKERILALLQPTKGGTVSLFPRRRTCLIDLAVFVGGNGGAQPVRFVSVYPSLANTTVQRHAELLAKDVPPSKVISIIDRFLAYYIMTADKLQRTARWIEAMDGGINVRPPFSNTIL